MKLFEITNGSVGESYVRCYAWAKTLEEALAMALPVFQTKYKDERSWNNLQADELFDSNADPFVTFPSDAGWYV